MIECAADGSACHLPECAGGCCELRARELKQSLSTYPLESNETPLSIIEELTAPAKVVQLVRDATKSALPSDTPARLRELADACERGEIGSMVVAAERLNEYEFHFPSSLTSTIVLIELLRERWGEKMRGG